MEYTYQNHPREKVNVIQLLNYELTLTSGATRHTIPYPDIVEVRLNKKRNFYSLHLRTLSFGTIYVTSQSFAPDGKRMDQLRAYQTFTRVLHLHLIEKSKAQYYTGPSLPATLMRFGMLLSFCAVFFVVNDYFQLLPGNSLTVTLLLLTSGTLLLVALQFNRWPKAYNPSTIPIHMLPSAT